MSIIVRRPCSSGPTDVEAPLIAWLKPSRRAGDLDIRITQIRTGPSYTRAVIFVTPSDRVNLLDVYLVDEHGYIEEFFPDPTSREFGWSPGGAPTTPFRRRAVTLDRLALRLYRS